MSEDINPKVDLRDRITARVNQGLLGTWYVVAKSVQVRGKKPFGVMVLGRKLALWRNSDGKVQCIEDYCPHRGAPMSLGNVHSKGLACAYHGVVMDGNGVVAEVPALKNCALEGRKAISSYEVYEQSDAIFVYIPSLSRPKAPSLVLPVELTDESWGKFLCHSIWECPYYYALDNLADPMHGSYLHGQSFTLAYGSKQDTMKLSKIENGFRIEREHQENVNFDYTEMIVDGTQIYCRLDIPYPPAAGPGGAFRIIGYCTPIDEKRCMVFFWRCRHTGSNLALQSWRFLYRTTLEARHWHVIEQDRVLLEAMPLNANKRELLYQHDIGITRLRQTLAWAARDQLIAEDAINAEGGNA